MLSMPWSFVSAALSVFSASNSSRKRWSARLLVVGLLLAFWDSASAQQLQTLHRHVQSQVIDGKAALVGGLPSDQQLHLSIVLPLRNQDKLDGLLSRLYDPTSPDYRKFLTVDQFADQFGATAADYQEIVFFAKKNGLVVNSSHANRLVVPVSGTVDQINRVLHVSMNAYRHPNEDRVFFSADREPSLATSVPVAHIAGLSDFNLPRPMRIPGKNAAPLANVTGSGPGGSYLGSDMRAAYYGGTTLTGVGQSVGLLEFDGYYLSDVDLNFSNAGQTNNVPINNVLLDGATGDPTTYGDDGEQVLDIVEAIGMAPGLSQIRVYIGSNDVDMLSSMASENIAKELSCSWSWVPDDPGTDDVFFKEFAAQGQSFFAASGDEGAYDQSVSPWFYPQEDDYVTAVGGTHLNTSAAGGEWASETAWNSTDPGTAYVGGSGGGISPDSIAIPSWQSGVANSSNGGSSTLRNVPDVAMEADFDNYLCEMGSCYGDAAGTSFAAPRWAGFMALVNQQAVEAGNAPNGGIGFINPAIYAIGTGSHYGSDFHDIKSGNNDTANQPTWFSAVAGYDLVTGWGSAKGQALIDALAGVQVPGFWISSSKSSVPISPGASSTTTIAITNADGFSGNVTLAVTSALPTGLTASWGTNPTSDSTVLTLTASADMAGGSYTLTITGTSGSLTETTQVSVNVHTPTFTLTALPSALSLSPGGSTTSTITLTPEYGFSSSANLSVSGLPSGVTASWSTNPTTSTSVLTLNASSAAVAGTSTLNITGTSGSLNVTTSVSLTVNGPSFTLGSAGTVNIGQGTTSSTSIYVNDLYGFNGNVTLAVSGLPSGVTGSFSPNPTQTFSTLTLTGSSTAALGNSTFTVTGTSGKLSATTTLTLGIFTPTFTISAPSTVDIGQGGSQTVNAYVTDQYGFSGTVTFSISGLPQGVTAVWTSNPTTSQTQVTFSVGSTVTPSQYPVVITGKSGAQIVTSAMTLGIHAPTFTLSSVGGLTVGQGSSQTTYISVFDQYGFTGAVNLSVSGLPSGVTASFTSNPTSYGSDLTLSATGAAPAGQYLLTVKGTSGAQTATTSITLTVAVPTFTILNYGTLAIGQGTTTTAPVWVYSQNGFNGSVAFSVSGLPSGLTASFSPNPSTTGSTLTLTASKTLATGQYVLTIKGTSGTQSATTSLTVTVAAPSFTIATPETISVGQGTTATAFADVIGQNGFTGNVTLSASGLPAGVTAAFTPNPTTSYSTLTLTVSSTAAVGTYTLTITGTSGSSTATTTLTLGIFVPTYTVSAGGITIGQGTTTTTWVSVYDQYGFTGSVNLSLSGLPSGVTSSFSANPVTSNTQLTFTVSNTAPIGQYTVTLTGTSNGQTATSTFPLSIAAQGFSLSAYLNSPSLNPGASGTATVYVNDQNGFTGNVSLAVSGLPDGVKASFSPSSTANQSTLTLTASDSAAPGTSTITITGTSGSVTASTILYLTINTPGFSISDAPNSISLRPGASGKSTVMISPQNGFDGTVNLAVSGLPTGVTGTFSVNSIAPGSSTLTLTADSTAAAGTATATITGTSGSLTSSAPLQVTIGGAGSTSATTTTTLSVNSAGSAVSSIAAGKVVSLVAQVMSGSASLKAGQVIFCDNAASTCDVLHSMGSAQLTSKGTAILSFVPGPGSHNYEARFVSTNSNATSTSAISKLDVTSSIATTTTITQSGDAGDYSLTATVTGKGWPVPSGTVSFLDTTNGNAVLGSAKLAQSKSGVSFQSVQSNIAVDSPSSVAVGDFNGDGILDMAIPNENTGVLSILIGNGDGTFTEEASSPQIASSFGVVVAGDFNHDGKVDLAFSNTSNNSVTIFIGNGDGTFTTGSTAATGPYPMSMVVGDFNGDGNLDLAVGSSANSLTILLGNGDGTFTASALSPQTAGQPTALVVADFNADGIQDLAVVNLYSTGLTILLGNGDGSFAPATSPLLTTASGNSLYANAISVGDFNNDGIVDLAVLSWSNTSVVILLGNGDGTFTPDDANLQTGSGYPTAIKVADFNGDGNADLAVAVEFDNSLLIFLGNGDGTFASTTSPSVGYLYPAVIEVGDFNGDGSPDLAAVGSNSQNISVLTSTPTQTSKATATGISPFGQGSHSVVASYPGDVAYKASTSSATQLTAQPGAPKVNVTPAASSITTLEPVSVAITVTSSTGNPIPTGSVVLSSGSYSSASVALSAGAASISIPAGSLPAGNDTLKVSYTPDSAGASSYLAASGSASITVTTPPGAVTPTVTVTPSSKAITNLQSDIVAITVTGPAGQATPTGNVTLSSGAYSAQQALSNGSASFTVPAGALGKGSDTLTAAYSGDATYAVATGSATVTVSPVLVGLPQPSPISPGSKATATATLTAGSDYSGTLNLTCALTASPSGAQSLPTCSLSPASVTLPSGGSVTTQLTVNTTGSSSASVLVPQRSTPWGLRSGGSALAVLLFVGTISRRRRRLGLLVLVCGILSAGMIACGGGSKSGVSTSSTSATSSGNYTFTVTATDSANPNIVTSTNLTITVQ